MKKGSQRKIWTIRRAENLLRRVFVPFFRRFKPKSREVEMLLPNVRRIMSALRSRSRQIKSNNIKVAEWVDQYINRSALNGTPILILTQWCLAKDLEVRFRNQNGFTPTKSERGLFSEEIPRIAKLFQDNSMEVRWVITFNRSYLDLGRIGKPIETEYCRMVSCLAKPLIDEGWLECLNWEDDLLGSRPEPDEEVLADITRFISPSAFEIDLERHRPWVEESGIKETEEELRRDVAFKIACEASEGQLVTDIGWYFGECIIIPLETPERYDFFGLKARRIKEQVVAVLPPYPWRV
jgi:hypothetical protein